MTPEQYDNWITSKTKHGAYAGGVEQPEHYIWRTMISRCNNPNASGYQYYGGRGITVCKRWHDYKKFIADMGLRPSPEYSLDRVNNNKPYSPSNCRWATRSEQQKNKNSTRIFTDGKFVGTLIECANKLKISKELAYWRFKTWGSFEKGTKWQQLPKAK
jgi:hypothetical protein